MQRYRMAGVLGDGSFGSVWRGEDVRNGETVAIKELKTTFTSWQECLHLREVASLTKLKHENIIRLRELVYVKEEGQLYFIFEFAEANLYAFCQARKALLSDSNSSFLSTALRSMPLASGSPLLSSGLYECEVRAVAGQLLRALSHMHKHGFFHRDVKPENILIVEERGGAERRGEDPAASSMTSANLPAYPVCFPHDSAASGGVNMTFKLCDFGQARETRSRPPYTPYVSTRWYRAPEVILCLENYNSPIDIWAAGCVMAELITGKPVFPGTSAMNQLYTIAGCIGFPTMADWPEGTRVANSMGLRMATEPAGSASLEAVLSAAGASPEAVNAVASMLRWDPSQRPSAGEVLNLPFFKPFMLALEDRDGVPHGATSLKRLQARRTSDPAVGLAPSGRSIEGWCEEQYRDSPAAIDADGKQRSTSSLEKQPCLGGSSAPHVEPATIDLDAELRSLNLLEHSPQRTASRPVSRPPTPEKLPESVVQRPVPTTTMAEAVAPVIAMRDVVSTKEQSVTNIDAELRELGLISPPKTNEPAGDTTEPSLRSRSTAGKEPESPRTKPSFLTSLFSGFKKSQGSPLGGSGAKATTSMSTIGSSAQEPQSVRPILSSEPIPTSGGPQSASKPPATALPAAQPVSRPPAAAAPSHTSRPSPAVSTNSTRSLHDTPTATPSMPLPRMSSANDIKADPTVDDLLAELDDM